MIANEAKDKRRGWIGAEALGEKRRSSRVLEKTRWQGLSKKFRIALTPSNLIRDAAERRARRRGYTCVRACARARGDRVKVS